LVAHVIESVVQGRQDEEDINSREKKQRENIESETDRRVNRISTIIVEEARVGDETRDAI